MYIAGHSWGAYLGLWFASEYPEYLYYYIGTGQGISSALDETEKYNFVLTQTQKRNDEKIIERLIFMALHSVEFMLMIIIQQVIMWEN
ncbi:MAG TPA: hypothetical protein IAA48_08735 [Candidatus Eubacterium faecipullorum]|uniref:Uncharacterized protein n=1 Tax=Candidatus Eubacterium faecipullorum TaxID=2838571 RepID=A0A9D1UG38_9FIRM|nr:hypothetical protein [Candidatus Eubacterium faecipullorum]